MVASGQADAFARYGLAMEYRKAGRIDEALQVFSDLRQSEPGYIPQYLMAGQMLTEASRIAEARDWLVAGKQAARAAGNTHALGELEDAIANLY
jgi:predicted Zn-dependent protease